jgi:multiple sugar transport system substrate-binding protein
LGELTAGDGIDGSQFWPFTWNQSLYEGEPYGIPFETDVRVLYYNRTLFTEAGLDPENPPQTWDELWQAADALDVIAEDGTLERIAFNPLAGNGPPGIWMLNNGHEWLQDGRPVVDDPAVVETLEWINRWIERYGGYENLQRFSQGFSAPPNDIFMSGAVAMKVDTAGYSSQMNFYRPRIQVGEDSVELAWGVSQIPHNEGAESTSASGGFTLSIPTGAPNPEAAWEFIKCAASVPAQVSWARDTYAIPNGPEAARSPELTADPNWDMFITAIESVPPDSSTFVPEYPNWETELANRYEQVWGGRLSPQEMLEQAQAAIDQQIGQ